MINMFPWQQRRPNTGITLAMAANPATQPPLLGTDGPTPPWVDPQGYRAPLPWRDPRPPYATQKTRPPTAWDRPLGTDEVAPPGDFGVDNALKGLAGDDGKPQHWFDYLDKFGNWIKGETPGKEYPMPSELGGTFDLPDVPGMRPESPATPGFNPTAPSPSSPSGPSGTSTSWMGGSPTPEEAEAAAEAEASGSGGGGGVRRPRYTPGATPLPDWGEMPGAPVFAGPDYSKANEYFEAAKPKPYEEDEWDARLAGLAGLAQGFSPEGTVGEILGRMAGPGLTAYAGAKEHEEEQQKEAEYALQQWNASMGTQAGAQAGTTAEVANQNTQAVYDNALQKRDALIQATEYARDEDRFLYESALQEAELDLRAAAENRQAAQDQWTRENTGGFKMEDDIYEGFTRGYIPGFEGDIQGFKTQVAQEEAAKLAAAAEAGDAHAKELLQRQTLDPSGWQKYIDGVAYSQFRQQLGQ
jgi:hypothetical protein